MRTVLAAKILASSVLALIVAGCSKPTELASDRNAVGGPTPFAPASVPSIPPPITELPPAGEPAPPDVAAPPGASTIDAEIKERFPDYKPKDTADTVLDFRSSVSGDVSALPSASDAASLAQAFLSWKAKAAASPGSYQPGAQQLGADAQEYTPSDAELVTAEAGDRLAAAMRSGDAAAKSAVAAVLTDASARSYKRFDYRHVDVLGSGRFFYSSPPRDSSIPG